MKKFKKVLNLTLISVMAVLVCFSSLNYAMADDVKNNNINNDQYDKNDLNIDHNYDDIVDSDMGSDDFEYENNKLNSFATFANIDNETSGSTSIKVTAKKDIEEVKPNKIIEMKATKAYKVTGLKYNHVIQKSYVATGYIFVSQADPYGNTYLSRCELKGNTATYKDEMKLLNFGHNQTLQAYSHNNKTYFLIGCKSNENDKEEKDDRDNFGHGLTIQVGRIQYKAGTTISNYTQINRMVRLDCANVTGQPFDKITQENKNKSSKIYTAIRRMDASLSSNKKYLILAVRGINQGIQYSYYDFNIINKLLDNVEGKSPNYISCYNNTSIKKACKFSCVQKNGERILPNKSCQGIDFTNAYSVYMSGGAGTSKRYDDNNYDYINYMPKIAKMVRNSNNGYTYSLCIRINNIYTSKYDSNGKLLKNNTTLKDYYMEIEEVQNSTDYLYFVLAPARVPGNRIEKSKTQYIYSLSKQEIDEKIS